MSEGEPTPVAPVAPVRRRRRLTRARRWAHVAIVPFALAALVAPTEPEGVLVGGAVVAVAVGVWLTRFASARVRTALDESTLVRALDLLLWNGALVVLALEVALGFASVRVKSPLLTAPNAKSLERLRMYRFAPYAPYMGGTTNSGGYHDTDWELPKPAGVFRIVALGDSFNFGIVPSRQNVLTLLEAELTRRCGARVEVANLGVASTSPVDYLYLLNDEGYRLEPDLVLTCLFVGNDIAMVRAGSRLRPANWLTFAVTQRLYQLVREHRRKAATPQVTGATANKIGEPMSPERYLELVQESYLPTLLVDPPAGIARRWSSTLEVVDRIDALAAGRHAIALYPCEAQVDPELLARGLAAAKLDPSAVDVASPARRIAAHFSPRGVPVFDLLPRFAARRAEGRAYEPNESHWNERGNSIAAQALADWLEPIVRARLSQ